MCVGSNGLVASRRKIILQNPSDEDLNKTKFCGVPLGQYMSSSLKNTSQLSKYIFSKIKEVAMAIDTDITTEMLQEVEENSDLFVYGEWIHRDCQTSDSKFDKYIYKEAITHSWRNWFNSRTYSRLYFERRKHDC